MKIITILILLQLIFSGVSFADDRPSNEIPMYGGEDKSHISPDKNWSKGVAQLGWQYFEKGDYDTAIKRFNQAWMLDNNNREALWGFGVIMGQRATQEEPLKNLTESIRYLNMSNSIGPENKLLLADLALSYTNLGATLKEENKNYSKAFAKADVLYEKIISMPPEIPIIYSNWSYLEFYKGNYFRAKELLSHAIKLGFKPDPEYEKELNEKL
ncbi:MAG: tetratricopeptide repeat protein [Bacteroidetes bacterium]|nr:tetratricopeptide repeat protein [Bacteroidota bacterium]